MGVKYFQSGNFITPSKSSITFGVRTGRLLSPNHVRTPNVSYWHCIYLHRRNKNTNRKGGFMALNFESYSQKAYEFLREVARELQTPEDLAYADRLVTAVLSVLRDTITPEESLNFIASLPMYLKAVYVNGWKLSWQPKRIEAREAFFEELREKYPRTSSRPLGTYQLARKDVKAVLRVLRKYVAEGEVQDIKAQLPQNIADLWEVEEYETNQQQARGGQP
jgi:uncharacterized protein (DUF2267 family)